ncbi:metallophosphoesterase family protein [Sphingomonas sp. RB3P16]|uniref:metallophosphoesterase family protein n=1 Tax=Parasphingomonas frigoris TaxID=3096163 RepID=UPI002FC5A216
MLKKLLSRRSAGEAVVPRPRIPAGQRVYAIGDIHGRLDLLTDLLDRIFADTAARLPAQTQLIFLGDLIDRGPESAGVIARLVGLASSEPHTRFLLGNHEEVFLSVLDGNYDALKFFTRIGGDATIASYGIDVGDHAAGTSRELLDRLRAAVPAEHRGFLQAFEEQIVIGDYAFVHAGVRPGVALAAQTSEDLRWIRGDFLDAKSAFEKYIVHGHTVTDDVDERANRIGLDTGAYRSGRLTAMGFEEDRRWVLQTDSP